MNNAAEVSMWIFIHKISLRSWLQFFEYIHRNEIVGSHSGSIFNFLRNYHRTLFLGCCIVLYSHQQLQWLEFFHIFVNNCYLLHNCYPNKYEVVFHCHFDLHFLIVDDYEHIFIYLLAICISSLEKHVQVLWQFLNQVIGEFLGSEL